MTETAVSHRKTSVDEAFALAPQHLKRLLGAQDVVDRFLVVALNQMRKVPQLATCTKESILDGLVRMARLDLDPSIPGEVYLVPYQKEASLIIGYGGLRKLVLRCPDVVDVFAQAVCENDHYQPAESPIALPTHRLPEAFKPRGRAMGYYAAAFLRSGFWRVIAMSRAEVVAHRDRYAASAKSTFWADNHPDKEGLTNFDKMGMKTCLRQLCSPRSLSLTAEVADALETEQTLYQPLPEAVQSPRPVPGLSGTVSAAALSEHLFGPGADPTAHVAPTASVAPTAVPQPVEPVNPLMGRIEEALTASGLDYDARADWWERMAATYPDLEEPTTLAMLYDELVSEHAPQSPQDGPGATKNPPEAPRTGAREERRPEYERQPGEEIDFFSE